ncbi:hypothetical protein F2Q68_00008310 [Brassica cretica]|uniref:Uncharacterized protein n=1 Tax=Brassica cretica TaxID=69181 RepID=A0A8S9L0K9_BRACR|nr:hypothetical protein F2Q68_00008310 [Brassica cretica]
MDFSWCKRRTISRVSPPLSTSSYRWSHRSSPTTTAQRLESSQSTGETCRDHCRYITTPPFFKVNKLKLLRCRDSSDQSQRKGEMVNLIKIFKGSAAVFVYNQPGAEAIFAYQMMSDRSNLGEPSAVYHQHCPPLLISGATDHRQLPRLNDLSHHSPPERHAVIIAVTSQHHRICSSKRNRDRSCAAKVIAVASWARISLSCCAAETVPTSLSVKKRIVIPSYILRVILVFARGSAAVFVYNQPGAEAIFAYQMMSDRSKLGGYGKRTYRITF